LKLQSSCHNGPVADLPGGVTGIGPAFSPQSLAKSAYRGGDFTTAQNEIASAIIENP
jgi:hypothetical protein